MCRNIRTLHNFEPPATRDEVQAAALQYVRKVSGPPGPPRSTRPPSTAAVAEVAATHPAAAGPPDHAAPPKDREVEAAKARARAEVRYA